jgi:thiol-disulfide isomerase/thioredoxin
MRSKWVFAMVGCASLLAGSLAWLATRATSPVAPIAPAALFAATFKGADSRAHPIGEFQGKLLVLNFWATWCAPCRAEMPAFNRAQAQWAGRGVGFLGLSSEDPSRVQAFGRELGIRYPLWTGGDEVMELSRRLGNRQAVLPYTVILDSQGRVLETRVGPYTENELHRILELSSAK